MQAIDILRDQRQALRMALGKSRQGTMAGIRFDLGDHFAAEGVPVPHRRGVGAKGLFGRQLLRIEFGPQAGLGIAKGRYARLGAHARACQHRDTPGRSQPPANLLNHVRCRRASYRQTPLATETFRLSTAPRIGMLTSSSQVLRVSWRMPAPSAPSTNATGAFRSA